MIIKTKMNVAQVKKMVKMIAPASTANKNIDIEFQRICVDSEDTICKLYILFSKGCNKEVQKYIDKSGYGRREIRRQYNVKERRKMYNLAKKTAKVFIKEGIYEMPELILLLNEITDVLVKYFKEAERQYNTPTPFFIRGIIALTAWQMVDVIRTVSIIAMGEPKKRFDSQNFILTYIHDRSVSKHNYQIFKQKKKMLTYKWGIKLTDMYNKSTYYAPEVPFNYAGHKDGVLGFIVREMLEQIEYKVYADVFGGSGRALLQFPLCRECCIISDKVIYEKEYYINDLNIYNYALYQCLQDKVLYKQMIKELMKRQEWFIELQARIADYSEYLNARNLAAFELGVISKKPLKIDSRLRKKSLKNVVKDKMLIVFNQQLHKEYDEMFERYNNAIVTTPVEMAVDFVLLHQFVVRGRPIEKKTRGINLFRELQDVMCAWNFDRDFKGMRNVYQSGNVKIYNCRDLQFINSLPNKSDVILQLDPPYIETAQYSVNQYSLQDIKALMDAIKKQNSKRKFIFHCQTIYNKTVSNTVKKKKVFIDFMKYWSTFNEELWVTFIVDINSKMIVSEETDETCIDAFLNSIFEVHGDFKQDMSAASSEIIITNFNVKITEKYNLQSIFNPYSVLLSTRSKDNTSYKVVTVSMSIYLPELLARL